MTTLTLESLGLTKDEIIARVVDKIANDVRHETLSDEDGEPIAGCSTRIEKEIQARVQAKLDACVAEIAERHVLPNIAKSVETLVIQETDRWGQKRGNPVTFIEYMVQRAEAYMTEQVDFRGNPKGTDSFSWNAKSTRVAHMIHEHLHYQIEQAMKKAIGDLNSSVAKGLHEATRMALNEVYSKLKVEVKTS